MTAKTLTTSKPTVGRIDRVAGPVVTVSGVRAAMYEVLLVGDEGLLGEVVQLRGKQTVVQVYEDTTGLKPGAPVHTTGAPLSVELGPGLLGQIYDGIQRPLPGLADQMGDFILRGATIPALDRERRWTFTPLVKVGDIVRGGSPLGSTPEFEAIVHRILVPPHIPESRVVAIESGDFTVTETIAKLEPVKTRRGGAGSKTTSLSSADSYEITMMQRWPVRQARPTVERYPCDRPMLTGQRVVDTFFPMAKGGAAAIPGPFGSGKTVTQQQLARWSDAHVVIYIGCGERGNEMTEILKEFPELTDPHTHRPLMERTVLIANTSNMPVAAREASCYTGITLAEYYRDMGYDVAILADSTSRWAEAMREISSRLEEMPGEEGYPAYLASRLAGFYERAGRCNTLCGEPGSVTVIGAVSPQGGDFSEPVTQNTLRIVKVFFGLDSRLAQRRHFPSINWLTSYSLYLDSMRDWYVKNVDPEQPVLRGKAMAILQKESELQDVVQLVGADSLPDEDRLLLEVGRVLREIFLQQNAYHPIDAYCSPQTQFLMLSSTMAYYEAATAALKQDYDLKDLLAIPALGDLTRSRFESNRDEILSGLSKRFKDEITALRPDASRPTINPDAAPIPVTTNK